VSRPGAGPADAGTVPVRCQVIDLEPFALDLVIPTYLPARDLTQRIARDAGLGAYWDDGSRRMFWLRARGRLLRDEERLEDLGIVPHELIHLLPQPPEGSGVQERRPEYPPNKGYAVAGWGNAAAGLGLMLAWTAAWAVALTVKQDLIVGILPSVGLALIATSFARHLVGGLGSSFKIPVLGLLVYLPFVVIAGVPAVLFSGQGVVPMLLILAPGVVVGFFGVLLGWLAWYGAVEPLPKQVVDEAQETEAAPIPCQICGGPVTPEVRTDCPFGCGRVFHTGCWNARAAVHSGDTCAVCGYNPHAA